MLTTDVDASLKLGTATAAFVEEEPAEGLYLSLIHISEPTRL